MKLHVGDEIIVTAGKDKGQTGKIEKVFPKTGRVLVPNINMYKKTRKGYGDQKGGVFEIPRSLPVASIALVCPNCKKPTRVGYRVTKTDKTRICLKCKRQIEVKTKTK